MLFAFLVFDCCFPEVLEMFFYLFRFSNVRLATMTRRVVNLRGTTFSFFFLRGMTYFFS